MARLCGILAVIRPGNTGLIFFIPEMVCHFCIESGFNAEFFQQLIKLTEVCREIKNKMEFGFYWPLQGKFIQALFSTKNFSFWTNQPTENVGSLQTLIMMGVIFFAKITIFRIYIQYLYFMFCCILVSNTQSDNYRLYPYELFQDHIHFSFATHKKGASSYKHYWYNECSFLCCQYTQTWHMFRL